MNCQVNDLAIVIGGEFPENWGAIIKVIGPGHHPASWRIEIKGRPLRGYNTKTGELAWSDQVEGPCVASDADMRPLRGLDQDELDQLTRRMDKVGKA